MRNFTAHTEQTRKEMLEFIGLSCPKELFEHIHPKLNSFDMPEPMSELEVQKEVKRIAKKNKTDYACFIGGGCYNRFIPAAVSQAAQRFEFLTAYTPYQPEISQGTLQIMYEYQSMISMLTGMDAANASVYDGGSACAEAVLTACRISKKNRVLISSGLNPEYKQVVETYLWGGDIEFEYFDNIPQNTADYAGVLIQTPDYYGELHEITPVGTILIVCTLPAALSVIKPPCNADIVVGDVQTLGIPMSFGGPHAGFMACKEKYVRNLPGRIAGKTVDAEGKTAYTLTLQTREQHIRREKATSNICSNQALIALCSALYLSLLGEKGFRQTGILASNNAHELSEKLAEKGIKTLNKNFFNEFVIEVDNADEFLDRLQKNNILGGLKIGDNRILVCATEMNTEEEIEKYVRSVS